MRQGFPRAWPGQTVGLLGGSFDPPHAGHVHITRAALARLGLDRVWWLVSPGNPLKPRGPAPMAQRLAAARALVAHPRVVVSDIEARLGTRHTARTLACLQARYPGVRFVWLMGADNLAGFHRWADWEKIFATVPIAVFSRPGIGGGALRARAALRYARFRLPQAKARMLARRKAPAWCYIDLPRRDISSTRIRARGGWTGGQARTRPETGPGG